MDELIAASFDRATWGSDLPLATIGWKVDSERLQLYVSLSQEATAEMIEAVSVMETEVMTDFLDLKVETSILPRSLWPDGVVTGDFDRSKLISNASRLGT